MSYWLAPRGRDEYLHETSSYEIIGSQSSGYINQSLSLVGQSKDEKDYGFNVAEAQVKGLVVGF
jgi:hypothetical protein